MDFEEQLSYVLEDPIRNYLSAIEHIRWSNFHLMRNFEYSPQRDDEKLKHDSLILDWDEFLASPVGDKAIYDFISVLNVRI